MGTCLARKTLLEGKLPNISLFPSVSSTLGVLEAVKRMSLLHFHGNTREQLHPWRNLPKSHPEALGRESPCQVRGWRWAWLGHGQDTHSSPALLFTRREKTNPLTNGDLRAQKVAAFATEPAIKNECVNLNQPQPLQGNQAEPKRKWGAVAGERGLLFALNPSWGLGWGGGKI